jgi:putative endonuclease
MFYVYVLKSKKDESLYIGYTNDLKRRFAEHNGKKNLSTKHKAPFELVYYEAYKALADARHREDMLKSFAAGYKELKKRIRNSIGLQVEGP